MLFKCSIFFSGYMDINLFQFFSLSLALLADYSEFYCNRFVTFLLYSIYMYYIQSSMTTIIAQINWKISVYHLLHIAVWWFDCYFSNWKQNEKQQQQKRTPLCFLRVVAYGVQVIGYLAIYICTLYMYITNAYRKQNLRLWNNERTKKAHASFLLWNCNQYYTGRYHFS